MSKATRLRSLLSAFSLISMLLLFPHHANANTIGSNIPSTGACSTFTEGAVDNCYSAVPGSTFGGSPLEVKTNAIIAGTAPGFIQAPPGSLWIAPLADTGCCGAGSVFDFRVLFNVPAGAGSVNLSGTIAALGSVAVSVNGLGVYLGPASLTALTPWSPTQAFSVQPGSNTLDFVFSGCVSFPSCSGSNEPVSALLIDPTWVVAAPGAPLATIPESVLLATGGVAPAAATPEPATLLLVGSGLAGIFASRKRMRCSNS